MAVNQLKATKLTQHKISFDESTHPTLKTVEELDYLIGNKTAQQTEDSVYQHLISEGLIGRARDQFDVEKYDNDELTTWDELKRWIWRNMDIPAALKKARQDYFDWKPSGGWSTAYRTFTNLCLLYTSPSPRDKRQSRMPSSA